MFVSLCVSLYVCICLSQTHLHTRSHKIPVRSYPASCVQKTHQVVFNPTKKQTNTKTKGYIFWLRGQIFSLSSFLFLFFPLFKSFIIKYKLKCSFFSFISYFDMCQDKKSKLYPHKNANKINYTHISTKCPNGSNASIVSDSLTNYTINQSKGALSADNFVLLWVNLLQTSLKRVFSF